MIKSGIDQDALVKMFSEASATQGQTLRHAVSEATLKALQGREMTLQNMRNVLKSVTQATSLGAAKNPASSVDVEGMLANALAGMDAAMLQAVEAQRKALQQFVEQGVGVQQTQIRPLWRVWKKWKTCSSPPSARLHNRRMCRCKAPGPACSNR